MGDDDQHCEGAGADEAVSESHLIWGVDWPARSTLRKSTDLRLPARPFVLVEFTQQNSGRCRMRASMRLTERVRAAYLSGAAHGPRAFTATAWAVRGECC